MRVALALIALSLPTTATAGPWITAETPAALAMSDTHEAVFRPGLMPAAGLYVGDRVALGVRARFGILRNGPAPGDHTADPGVGGLGTLGLALRGTLGRTWIEAVGGGGVTGGDLVPAVELGVGWMFETDSFAVGPSLRYVRVMATDPMQRFGSADLALVGVDLRFGHREPRARVPAMVAAAPVVARPLEPVAVIGPVEADRDFAVEAETSCAIELEGCPLSKDVFITPERHIVLADQVMFEFNASSMRDRGDDAIALIADAWHAHAEWTHITIEGHADVRGDDAYNLVLSQKRADTVRTALLRHGFAPDSVDAVGYGRSRPLDPGSDEAAHAKNRRVEFVIVSHGDAQ